MTNAMTAPITYPEDDSIPELVEVMTKIIAFIKNLYKANIPLNPYGFYKDYSSEYKDFIKIFLCCKNSQKHRSQ